VLLNNGNSWVLASLLRSRCGAERIRGSTLKPHAHHDGRRQGREKWPLRDSREQTVAIEFVHKPIRGSPNEGKPVHPRRGREHVASRQGCAHRHDRGGTMWCAYASPYSPLSPLPSRSSRATLSSSSSGSARRSSSSSPVGDYGRPEHLRARLGQAGEMTYKDAEATFHEAGADPGHLKRRTMRSMASSTRSRKLQAAPRPLTLEPEQNHACAARAKRGFADPAPQPTHGFRPGE